MLNKRVVVIGAGFAGLSAATHLADQGYQVTLLEKNDTPGGRARKFETEGFVFDMGPSWYWMPDVFDTYFAHFGKKTADYYNLVRLDPSYAVIFGQDDFVNIPANPTEFRNLMEKMEPGVGPKLDEFLKQGAYKYKVGIQNLVYRPSRSILEFVSPRLLLDMVHLNIFQSMSKHVREFFKAEKILRLMEFPVLFLGETAENIPALYSLMNYADISLGTWYPMGGMHKIIEGMVTLAEEKGVQIRYDCAVSKINVTNGKAESLTLSSGEKIEADIIIAGADYHHVDTMLLAPELRNYSPKYWDSRVMAPSSLLFYLGIDKKLENLLHHNLFFDEPLGPHADAIYKNPRWPEKPLFYVSAPSVTDPSVAPDGKENLFLLIPLAPDLVDTEELREKYFNMIMDRLEKLTGQEIRSHIIYKRSYALSDFKADYNAFKGNAYGLANTLWQTAFLKPSLKNKKVKNLYYTGQLTVPGPGVPPSLISGHVVAKEVIKEYSLQK
ncbi:phytoene dehydrogenase [Rhodonellum psychrophilum GCM71 = DSM 17998]|uniref:Phytoene dehydrogenase n=2 Tax=Rhodonellum TaxID=336827 RepID=U5BQN4_9BACT|nr:MULTISPECIES: phytoene desaturase family protein [Rhodonellum]ERM82870.1 phytoene dehydrogenase [Rhodonellum psychrophilum GCM71 = DSM 17998]MDO9552544.1 phytoene desaturase family protein [Rhodonellum sp.]SDY46648.1 phytoene desaturase [Rhodonellum ikkaensis]